MLSCRLLLIVATAKNRSDISSYTFFGSFQMCQAGQCSVSACSRFNMVACSPGQSRPCEVHCQLRSRPETCRPSSQLESLFSQGPVYHGQVRLLTQFCFSLHFQKKSLICLESKFMTPLKEDIDLFYSFLQLP